jgi:feruloyl esterase
LSRASWPKSIRVSLLLATLARATYVLAAPAHDCAGLAHIQLADTRIVGAEVVAGPSFQPPGAPTPLADLPAFCRVSAMVSPAIRFELWLPLADWNGKFQGTGNGGYSGAIVYSALATGLRRHYATSSTDMGHLSTTPDPGSWALRAPQLVVDQGYRAQHETAVKSKEIIRAFYGAKPRLSYFTGCSSGGWQGLTEAQRYPHEYDGIVAGAPAFEVVHLHAGTLYVHLAALRIPPPKLRMITDAVLAKCDAADGVKDGLLANPLACNFAPTELACRAGQTPATCLTPDEVDALQRIYDGARYASGAQIYPGWPRGVEYALIATQQPAVAALASSTFKDMVFENPSWDFHRMNLDRDVPQADARVGAVLNNYSPDLRAFRQAGGKLILWHGWDDPLISPLHTLAYYRGLAHYFAPKTSEESGIANVQSFARLFLAPGVNHCRGGPGPDDFDALTALEQWVEKGVAPERIVAAHKSGGAVDRTRPLCPYPKVAGYNGQGSTDEADSFTCRMP